MPVSWTHSRTQILDLNGEVSPGALAYFYLGNTSTPVQVFTDKTLLVPHTQPVTADANGRFPRVYLNYGDYRERVTTATGVALWDDDGISYPDPAAGSSGGGTSSALETGLLVFSVQQGTRAGYVRANGRTIGSATSGATERANADCEALYTFLWNNVINTYAPVSGGRGASAAADWALNKTIGLPDLRGRAPFGLDGMGNGLANRLANGTIDGTGGTDVPGSGGGAATHTLTEAQIPAHTHTATVNDPGHTHSVPQGGSGVATANTGGSTAATQAGQTTGSATTGITVTNASTGGGQAHNNLPPLALGTWFIKL